MYDIWIGDAIFDALVRMELGRNNGDKISAIANKQARLDAGETRALPRDELRPCRCGCGRETGGNYRGLFRGCYQQAKRDGTLDDLYPAQRSIR
jgi:hypothetical protein